MRRFEERAPAKLNLCLRITARRPDGYHELDSCVVFTEWADRLTIVPDDAARRSSSPARSRRRSRPSRTIS